MCFDNYIFLGNHNPSQNNTFSPPERVLRSTPLVITDLVSVTIAVSSVLESYKKGITQYVSSEYDFIPST